MANLPKFDFSKSSIKSTDQLNKTLEETGQKDKSYDFFLPGSYAVEVVKAEYQGEASDSNWGKYLLVLEGVGGRTINQQLLVPMKDIQYKTKSGEYTLFLFKKFVKTMSALGVDVTVESLQETLIKYFSNPAKTLVGIKVNIEVNYRGNHIKYEGKDDAGATRFSIVLANGTPVAGTDGQTQIFADRDAALNYATETLKLEVSRFVEIVNMSRIAAANVAPIKKAASNW